MGITELPGDCVEDEGCTGTKSVAEDTQKNCVNRANYNELSTASALTMAETICRIIIVQ